MSNKQRVMSNEQRVTRLTGFVIAILVAGSAFAHDMYLWPRFDKSESHTIILPMFVEDKEVVWFESMTAGFKMSGPDGEVRLTVPEKGEPIIHFEQPGSYLIGWQSEPFFLQVEPEIFQKYVQLEGYTDIPLVKAKLPQQSVPGREIYTRFIKTCVQIGSTLTDNCMKAIGYKIEIIPLTNPSALIRNSELEVQVLYDGKPLQNHRIMATYDSYSELPEDYAQVTRTDEKGIAKFQITSNGLWMIRSNYMLPLENQPEADWQSFWANFTFEVK